LEKTERPFTNPYFYFDFKLDSLDPNPYIDLDYAPLEERMKSYTRYARNIPRALDQIRSNLRMPMARTLLQYGIDSFGGFAVYFRNDVPSVFAAVEAAALQQEFAEANAAAADAMQEMTDWLTSNLQTATENYAIGPELFRQMIYDAERVDVSLEELVGAIRTVAEGGSMVKPAVTQRLLKGLKDMHTDFSSLDRPDPLTERETEILRLMAGGYSNKEIANSLGVAEGTVKNHVSNILSKMGVRDRTRAVLKAFEMSLL